MKFSCPQCGQHLEAEPVLFGHVIPCPACAQSITVPAEQSAATARTPVRVRGFRPVTLAAAVLGLALIAGAVVFGSASNTVAPSELHVFPTNINLTTRSDRQSMVVQAVYPDGLTRDVTLAASISLENAALARIDKGIITPLTDGATAVNVKFGGHKVTLPLKVEQAKVERPISFNLDVMPVFMKAGCNAGGCHGASRGKDGFQLSLFGYDADGDYFRLTRESIGRRINLALPEESLLLEKALAKVPHGGGERFKADSELYSTVMRWIEAGVPKDGTNVAKVVGLSLMPRNAVLEGSNATQRVTVRATYSDGTDRDVTSLAAFYSNNEPVAKVSDSGVITAGQRGEAYVTARFETFTVGAQMLVVPKDQKFEWPNVPENNYVDTFIHAKLKKLRITPSDMCDDATFIRRAYIDITGTLPTPAEVQSFCDEMSTGKRADLVDKLLERKEFADLWVMKFAELLQIRSNNDQFSYKSALLYYNWLQDRFTKNTPIDQIVKDLITAEGSNFRNPAASYYEVERETLKTAENVAQVFMGMRIQCAQCHNHPFDRWTMNDYYSFAAFFPQVSRKQGDDPREAIIFAKRDGEVNHPVTKKPMAPKFLGGEAPTIKAGEDRRKVLAEWLASTNNAYFARNMANLIWAHFMGKGIIEPVDDVRISNPAINPELLEALGQKFTDYKYDFKKLVRDICTSRTYQLSTRANESNALDDRNFARASIRRMRAEVLLDCINAVTGAADKFQGLPRGARAVEIADGNVNTYFLRTFGRATRTTPCSCEVRVEPNLSQALHLLNGDSTQGKIASGNTLRQLKAKHKDAPLKAVEELYMHCLARRPTEKELARLKPYFEGEKPSEKATEQALTDVFWALLNSKEFIFNH